VQDGILPAGSIHVTEPATPVRCLFRGPYDVLHLHVPHALVADMAQHLPGGAPATLCHRSAPARLPAIEPLARALLDAERLDGLLGPIYADCIGVAIVSRLLAARPTDPLGGGSQGPAWCPGGLRRTLELRGGPSRGADRPGRHGCRGGIDADAFRGTVQALDRFSPAPVPLLRRRIERAQDMLTAQGTPLVDVALSVGFQSQIPLHHGVFEAADRRDAACLARGRRAIRSPAGRWRGDPETATMRKRPSCIAFGSGARCVLVFLCMLAAGNAFQNREK